ncbi:class I SAM-dependent methyltransferase [Desertibacillus haloalkaliphilus]|uniref:class I SAM-dependent methyltransferase n=1 Tax=Desertibacillus haloalkaliphilus TaxID=1328930 RepID=UPI001C26E0F3|nr:methyltransferase domain-containing protein [Desertibacillus haloalkaliphilus]MBU8906934.1 methyltransferase domain-containing protein [Desertibacillus haloalkaliphilus]
MDKMNFLQGFLRSPFEVGSVIPSSKTMVKRIGDFVQQEQPKTIVELGAGTGVFTQELKAYSDKQDAHLHVFEKDEKMRTNLKHQFPQLSLHEDALQLPDTLEQLELNGVDCIVCGLPFSLFPKSKTEELFKHIHANLNEGGCFMMYQYSTHMKKRLIELFDDVSIHYVLLNIPPAFVYFCKKY